MTVKERHEKHAALEQCVRTHHELMRVGLYATGQLMHEVVRRSGWELAEQIAKETK